jgi:hypothetical protein
MLRVALVIVASLAVSGASADNAHAVPLVTWTCNGSPCSGWFNADVRLVWNVKTGQVVGPTCQNTTIVNDTAGIDRFCVVQDADGEVTYKATIKLDKTPPVVTGAVPDRPPDHAGWYKRPVTFVTHGSDALSGLAACDSPSYGGPDSATAAILATCRDVAGNVATRSFTLSYDATPPDLSAAIVTTADRVVRLSWSAGATATLVRTPGFEGAPSAVVFEGPGAGFIDRRVRNGRQYRYVLTVSDAAGNAASRDFMVIPGPRLLAPDKRALVAAPPLLKWTAVRGARYYNVQLFRDGRKILSAWPKRPQLQLRKTWRFRGRRHRLVDGRYQWYVWPGVGSRSARKYGERIGARSFVLDRP